MNFPIIGLLFHWLGGLASASFYIPYKGVRRWSWETYWLVGGVFSWVIAPLLFAAILVPDFPHLIAQTPGPAIGLMFMFGCLWGIGGLTFGLTMRYLGIALGMAIALGLCTAFGTLIPPIARGQLVDMLHKPSGLWTVGGVVVCLVGIAISGLAGMSKERELSTEQKRAAVKEFNFTKGIAIATLSGVMSACFAFGLDQGKPLNELTKAHLLKVGRLDLWANLPVLIVVLWGGFTTNFIWCVLLNLKNRSGGEYLAPTTTRHPEAVMEMAALAGMGDDPGDPTRMASATTAAVADRQSAASLPVPLLVNYALSATAGVLWYLQFFFYSMGEMKMGDYKFASWSLHMASIIIFSTLWGLALREFRGSSRRTLSLVSAGLIVLVVSTVVVGKGMNLAAEEKKSTDASAVSKVDRPR